MDFKKELVKAITKAGVKEAGQLLEIPPDESMGNYALPCFRLAREYKKNPSMIAGELAKKIILPKNFEKIEVRGAYINFFVENSTMAQKILGEAIAKGKNTKKGKPIIVEYCQANPMKAFHIGHLRNICLGESIARLFESQGRKVKRVDYGGDVGPHVSKTIFAYRNIKHSPEPKEAVEKEKWVGELYAAGAKAVETNPVLEEKMREMVVALERGTGKQLTADWKKLRKTSLNGFKRIFQELGVKFDHIILESEVEKEGIRIANELHSLGIALKDEGALLVDLSEHGLEKFLILKSDGAALYSSKDLALAKLKKEKLGADTSYNVVGSEQTLYFRQLAKTIELLNARKKEYCTTIHIPYELVRLEGGKMASREGNVITYRELSDRVFEKTVAETKQRHGNWSEKKILSTARQISLAAIKFGMLSHDRNRLITFNWEKATSLEGETGPFVLYSYARAKSIISRAGKTTSPKKIWLSHPKEKKLLALLSAFRCKVQSAAASHSPHTIAHYLLELASEFNSFYHEVPVLRSGDKEKRLLLVKGTAETIKKGLWLLNITPVEEM